MSAEWLQELKRWPDRKRHAGRRDRALEIVRAWTAGSAANAVKGGSEGGDPTLVFVCKGNICRSPFAEGLAEQMLAPTLSGIAVRSAGFLAAGRSAPPLGVATARQYGVDLSAHRSAGLTSEVVRGVPESPTLALVVVMSSDQRDAIRARFGDAQPVVILGDLDPEAIDTRTIVDPWDGDELVFGASYARIARCVRVLVDTISQQHRRGDVAA